jgi:hypothetical protein
VRVSHGPGRSRRFPTTHVCGYADIFFLVSYRLGKRINGVHSVWKSKDGYAGG